MAVEAEYTKLIIERGEGLANHAATTVQVASLRAALKAQQRQIHAAEKRAHEASTALTIERHESFRMIRHLTNQLLRAKEIGAYPLVAEEEGDSRKPAPPSRPLPFEEVVDPGELDALYAAADDSGVSREAALEFLRKEKGYS